MREGAGLRGPARRGARRHPHALQGGVPAPADTQSPAAHPPPSPQAHLPPPQLAEARRVLFGVNQGAPVAGGGVDIPPAAAAAAAAAGLVLRTAVFSAAPEQLRPPRTVRVGLLQHSIVEPTTAPFEAQRAALHARVAAAAEAAGAAGVKILCTQEAWPMPFGVCTREKVWCEFAEGAEAGPSTRLLQPIARRHGMAIVSCILERDEGAQDTVWNTAVVIGPGGNVVGKHRKASRR